MTFEDFQATLSTKTGKQAAEVMFDLMSGEDDVAISKVMSTTQPLAASQWICKDSNLEGLKELHRLVTAHKNTVGVGADAPPEAGSRALKRCASDSGCTEDAVQDITKEQNTA